MSGVGSGPEVSEYTSAELRAIFHNVGDAIYVLDEDGDVLDVNDTATARHDRSREQLRSLTFEELSSRAAMQADVLERVEQAANGEEQTFEWVGRTADGDDFRAEVTATPADVGGKQRVLAVARRLDDRTARERELERKNDLLEQAQEIADLGAWETDLRNDQGWWTRKVAEIYGLPHDYEPEPGEGIEYYHPEDRPTIRAAFEQAVEAGDSYDLELRVVDEAGERKWVRTRGRPLVEDGEVVAVRGTIRDVTARKDRERELERTRQRLRVLFDEAPDTIVVHDDEGNVVDPNQRLVAELGYSRDELTSMNVLDFEVGMTVEEARELWEGMDVGDTEEVKGEHRRKDGSTFPVEVWINKVAVDDEPRYLAMARDVTDRREREQQLEQFREAVERTGHAIYITDADGTIEYVNPAFEEVTGYAEAEVLGNTPHVLEPDEDGEGFYEGFWETITADQRWEAEMRDERADGERLILHQTVSPLTDEDGDPRKFVAVAQDVTDRTEYEEALERARKELRQIIDLVPDLIFSKNRDGEYLLANEATAAAYGTTPAAVEGSPEHEVIPDAEDSAAFREDDREVIESGESTEIPEEELTTADGETKILQTTKIPYEVPGSGEDAVLGYARDVTELKVYERTLERQRDNLEVLNQVVRHDIRNDLQLVLAYAETLESHVEGTGQEYVQHVLEAARDAVEITQTARDVTEIMLQTQADNTPTRLRYVLEEQIEDLRTGHEHAVVTVDGPIPDVTVLADDMLASVFRNLLTNAIVHNDAAVPEVSVSVTTEADAVRVRVADNGPGIPDDQKEQIFQEGEKGLDSEGTGLGLYLVRTLVDRYGGDVWVEDNDPNGSVFVVELPRVA